MKFCITSGLLNTNNNNKKKEKVFIFSAAFYISVEYRDVNP